MLSSRAGECAWVRGRRRRARLGGTALGAGPGRHGAVVIADLLWWTALGSAVLWLAAAGFLLYCLRPPVAGVVDAAPVADAADLRVRVAGALMAATHRATRKR